MQLRALTQPPAHGYRRATAEPVRLREVEGTDRPIFLSYAESARLIRLNATYYLANGGAGLAHLLRTHGGPRMWLYITHGIRIKLWDLLCPSGGATWERFGHDFYPTIVEVAEQVAQVLKTYTEIKTQPRDKCCRTDAEALEFIESLRPEDHALFEQAIVARLKLHGKPYERSCPSPSTMSAVTAALLPT